MCNDDSKVFCPFLNRECIGNECAMWRTVREDTLEFNEQCGIAALIEDVRTIRAKIAPEERSKIYEELRRSGRL